MIHYCDVVVTPRRVTVIPSVPATVPSSARRMATALIGTLLLVLVTAVSLGAQASSPARADSAPTTPARNINWTSDKRAFGVGDVLQVMVDEATIAAATKDNTNSASRRRRMDMGINPPTPPGGASSLGKIDGSLETGDGSSSQQRGNATRSTRYVGDLAVRVVAVTPEGLLQIKGTKTIDVDKNKAVLTLTGLVRPIDVSARDIVRSETIADAQISYQAKGGLGKPNNGIVSKLIGLFWP
ncbi:MAG: flagellar basal body L-ring protein FlgH [Gemmatimonadaceae bacterium]